MYFWININYKNVNFKLCNICVNIVLYGSPDDFVIVVNKMKTNRFNIHKLENYTNVNNAEVTLIPNCALKG
jgi:hypothetical protein